MSKDIDYSDYEKELPKEQFEALKIIVHGLGTKVGISKAVTNEQICQGLKKTNLNLLVSEVRKLTNLIQRHGMVKWLISNSQGFYVAETEKEVRDFINALKRSESAMKEIRLNLEFQVMDDIKTVPVPPKD